MRICLFGSGSNNIDEKYLDDGFRLGQSMAKRGHSLVFGGGSNGMMGAVARGVNSEGENILAIFPEWMTRYEDLYDNSTQVIYTSSMDERKKLFVEHSDAFIISPGGIGTLDEFFEVLTLKKLNITNSAIVILNIDEFYNCLIEMIEFMIEKKVIPEDNLEIFHVADSIDDALDYIEGYDVENVRKFEIYDK